MAVCSVDSACHDSFDHLLNGGLAIDAGDCGRFAVLDLVDRVLGDLGHGVGKTGRRPASVPPSSGVPVHEAGGRRRFENTVARAADVSAEISLIMISSSTGRCGA
jgi:hypothetical protein